MLRFLKNQLQSRQSNLSRQLHSTHTSVNSNALSLSTLMEANFYSQHRPLWIDVDTNQDLNWSHRYGK